MFRIRTLEPAAARSYSYSTYKMAVRGHKIQRDLATLRSRKTLFSSFLSAAAAATLGLSSRGSAHTHTHSPTEADTHAYSLLELLATFLLPSFTTLRQEEKFCTKFTATPETGTPGDWPRSAGGTGHRHARTHRAVKNRDPLSFFSETRPRTIRRSENLSTPWSPVKN